MSDWVRSALDALTVEEKATLVAGRDLWHTNPVARLGIPVLKVVDGPNGARGADGNHGPTSTSFPVGVAMGATWDPDLIESVGRALAHETRAKGAHVLLGPTVNIPRVPNAGRNFECFSEDPVLSGALAATYIRGLQDEGVAACIKHFVCNDQEHDRYNVDVQVDDRALREVYLEPFRFAIEQSSPWAVMSAYNTINGTTASEHDMLDEILRAEFGFDGLVMSDWFGTYGPGVMTSGLDLEMPGPGRWLGADAVLAAHAAGEISEDALNRKVERLLRLIERTDARQRTDLTERADERSADRALARRVAAEAIVLLTNDGLLPLANPQRIAVIGELASATPNQGGGSSSVNAHRVVSILDGIRAAAGGDTEITWEAGCGVGKGLPGLDPASLDEPGFSAEYFDGTELSGDPVRSVTSRRPFLAFFGHGDDWVDYDSFSVRMSGRFLARATGRHGFSVGAEGRLRVWMGDDLVVDDWENPSNQTHEWTAEFESGEIRSLVIEYASSPGERWRWLGIGCRVPGPAVSIESAVAAAAAADVAVVVAGLNQDWESEGFDRPNLALPGDQDALIAAVAAAQPNTVVVLTTGSPVEMPWLDEVSAVIEAWYGGQEVGHAVADVLYGVEDPGGRLPVTFPANSRQHPGLLNYPGEVGIVRYGEGVHVGYHGFDKLGLEPMFRFGHGLSYATFEVSTLGCRRDGDEVTVEVEVANTSDQRGTEVVQVFAEDIAFVDRRLVDFQKVRLDAGATATVELRFSRDRLRWWDPVGSVWQHPEGQVTLSVWASGHATGGSAQLSPE